jgi:hypothetical protein
VQDRDLETDLPRLADRIEAANYAGVPRLRNVSIREGWIYAERPETTEESQWWKPVEVYYRAGKPYLALATCGETPGEIARFLQDYGAISVDRRCEGPNRVRFRLSEFDRERWCFAFAMDLASALKNPALLQDIFLTRADEAAQRLWHSAMERIRWALNVPRPQETTKVYHAYLFRQLRGYLKQVSEKALGESAASYLTAVISERLRNIKVVFECEADGRARLSAQCFDDLLTSFYWMLANDLATHHGPARCAYCKRFFFTDKQNVAYCSRPECKERGRRKLDWARNKAKYNRTRRRKRAAERKEG